MVRDKDKDKDQEKCKVRRFSLARATATVLQQYGFQQKIRNLKDSCNRRGKRFDILRDLRLPISFGLLVDYPSINMPSLKFLHGWITRLHFVVQRILSNGSEALCHIHPRHYRNPTIKYQLKRFWTFYSATHFRKLAQPSIF